MVFTRRTLWHNFLSFAPARSSPWLLLGDFNSVMLEGGRVHRSPITPYETNNILDCYLTLGLMDINSIGCVILIT